MRVLKFKTNINCSSCVNAVTTALNDAAGEGNWRVDTNDPQKVLTVNTEKLNAGEIEEAVKKAGFDAAAIS